MEILGGAAFQRLESGLNAATMRQKVIANNIANGDVPYFKRSDVVFEEMLSHVMGTQDRAGLAGKMTHQKHIPINHSYYAPAPRVVADESTAINNNHNNVDIDKEMSLLAENQLRYNLLVQQISHDVKMMRIGIEGRV